LGKNNIINKKEKCMSTFQNEIGKRKNLGIICTEEELQTIQLIQNKISCASQAASPLSIPNGISEEKAKWYIQAAIDSLASYRWLESEWWKEMKLKYSLPQGHNVWIDFDTKEFYIIEQ